MQRILLLATMACSHARHPQPATPQVPTRDPPYQTRDPAYQNMECNLDLDFDQETVPNPGQRGPRKVYSQPKDYSRLHADLECSSPGRLFLEHDGAGPLCNVTAIQIKSGDGVTLATIEPREFQYVAVNDSGFRGHPIEHHERIRIFLGPTASLHVRDTHPWKLTFTATDKHGTIVHAQTMTGNEAGAGIQPRPYRGFIVEAFLEPSASKGNCRTGEP